MPQHPPHILITGGSQGIGLAIAQLFAKNAYRCTLIARSEDKLKAAISSLQPLPSTTSPSLSHTYIKANIANPHFWSDPSSPFTTHFPKPPPPSTQHHPSKIDVLVNCAGIMQASIFLRTDDAAIHDIVQTNLAGLMIGTRFLLKYGYLRGSRKQTCTCQQQSPVIINLSSLLGVRGGHGAVAYAASKAGVLGFTRALATEYAVHRVRVNAIVPGYIETGMVRGLDAGELEGKIPLGRLGTAEEIAHAALFLAENQYAHNCVLNLDGGLSAI